MCVCYIGCSSPHRAWSTRHRERRVCGRTTWHLGQGDAEDRHCGRFRDEAAWRHLRQHVSKVRRLYLPAHSQQNCSEQLEQITCSFLWYRLQSTLDWLESLRITKSEMILLRIEKNRLQDIRYKITWTDTTVVYNIWGRHCSLCISAWLTVLCHLPLTVLPSYAEAVG